MALERAMVQNMPDGLKHQQDLHPVSTMPAPTIRPQERASSSPVRYYLSVRSSGATGGESSGRQRQVRYEHGRMSWAQGVDLVGDLDTLMAEPAGYLGDRDPLGQGGGGVEVAQ